MDLTPQKNFMQAGSLIAGRYEVVRALGSGGMGTVLLVTDRALDNEEVALKLLFPHLAQDQTAFARFRNEVLIARKLSHPNVVRLYDIGNAGGGYFFISMELVRGGPLTKKIYQNRHDLLEFQETLRILKETAEGIAHAHSLGVVHRDLKPDNILLTERGQVKVTDFGLARTLYLDQGFTQSGEAVGTPYYMAPEQLRGEKVDGRADIYALGLIAFEMVVGRRPFFEENYHELAMMHLRVPLPDFATKESGIPKWYEDFVKRCAEKKPEKRFQSADEIAALLEERIEATGDKRLRKRPAVLSFYAHDNRRKRSAVTTTVVSVLLVALMAGGGYAAFQKAPPELKRSGMRVLGSVIPYFAAKVDPTQLFRAIEMGDADLSKQVINQGVDPNVVDSAGKSALLVAIEQAQPAVALAILQSGANPDFGDKTANVTPLMAAVRDESFVPVVQELLARNANPNERNAEWETALIRAVKSGNSRAVKELIERNAWLNPQDKQEKTALMYAVAAGDEKIVEMLTSKGTGANDDKRINLELRDGLQRTVLFTAVQLKDEKITELLLKRGAQVMPKDMNEQTPLDVATTRNKKALLEHLRKLGQANG